MSAKYHCNNASCSCNQKVGINVEECPSCGKHDTRYFCIVPQKRHNETEVWMSKYCPDCGYSYYLVYTPDRTEEGL